jgi:hypothetical protein
MPGNITGPIRNVLVSEPATSNLIEIECCLVGFLDERQVAAFREKAYLSLSATFSTPAFAQASSPAWLLPLTPTPPIVSLPTLIG